MCGREPLLSTGRSVVRSPARVLDAVLYTAAFWVFVASVWMDVLFWAGPWAGSRRTPCGFTWTSTPSGARRGRCSKGGDIYDTGARLVNLNPPVWTVLISPLGLMEAIDAYRLFVLLSVVVLGTWPGRPRRSVCGPGGRSWGGVAAPFLAPDLDAGARAGVPGVGPGAGGGLDPGPQGGRRLSGVALGLVVALKPSLAPVLLWPLVRRRWGAFAAACVSGPGGDARRPRRARARGYLALRRGA